MGENVDDTIRCLLGGDVLPDTEYRPASITQTLCDPRIALDRAGELALPVARISPRYMAVLWALVPEAAVDKDGEPQPREDNVGRRADIFCPKEYVLAEAQAAAVQNGPHRELGTGVRTAIALHGCGHRSALGIWIRKVSSHRGRTKVDMTSTDGGNPSEPSLAVKARTVLEQTIRGLVEGEPSVTAKAAAAKPPDDVRALLDDLLSKRDTYRDGALTLLAFPVAAGEPLDVTRRIDGDRAASGYLEDLLRDLKIPARRDALQTIAKGSSTFLGRARKSWNELLEWASEEEALDHIEAAFLYIARAIAATARALPPLPRLDVSRLTFRQVVDLLDELLATPSGGAYEQFIFGALLYATAEQEGGRRRVDTKSLTAADASAGTAADVQVWDGGVVAEAYEVTANVWHSKVTQALDTLRKHDLRRVHILAPAPKVTAAEIAAHVPEDADVSVLDVRHEVRSLVHRLQRTGRRVALEKLYEHLVERQPRDDLVSQYVNAISARQLTE